LESVYAVITRAQIKKGKWGTVAEIWRDELIGLLAQHPGYQGVTVFGDHDTGRGGALLRFETREQLKHAMQSPEMQEVLARLQDLYVSPVERDVVQILLDDPQ
jgi:antibiotic biosynthesis monooxygenase (ABM) superfamily enzyme